MTPSIPVGEVRPLGDRALQIGVADAASARLLAGELARALTGVAEVVGGVATVLIRVTAEDAELRSVWATAEAVRDEAVRDEAVGRRQSDLSAGVGRVVTIPCRFDGPDLDAVATLAGCRPDAVVALLTAQPLTVAVVGFSPGFAYLGDLPSPLDRVPRRDRPRPVVPAGSVAIANGQAAVYPTASPGGWHLVGRTGFPLFSARRAPYAVLAPGDQVRFTEAEDGAPVEPTPVLAPPSTLPLDARPVFDVVAPGLRAVLQDGGRTDVAAAGVPGAGPADPVSFALANRMTNNAPGAGTLELTGGGTRLTCLGACHVAVVGGAPEVRVDGGPVPAGQLLPLGPGQTLEVGRPRAGCRTYVAVAGGLLGPAWFGSTARDDLTGLGAPPLAHGDVVHAGPWSPPLGDHLAAGAATELDLASPVELRVLPGPHAEQFDAAALERLAATVFDVEPDSNRVGLRLRPASDVPSLRSGPRRGGLDSQGVVTGAVQVPPDGHPVVLLPDHATLGGYPVVAVVVSADHGALGQCAPGTRVRFVPIGLDEAVEVGRAMRREQAGAVVGTYPLAVD